ncbi:hypothetical protein VN97_g2685 [Penicillium thymicola]|uniref:Uncharacterized protein n=1 Tax=Penicillium thymicola TaxID=293382 RepID=A0AAI9TPE6_PENTH|nr:hypothetical protein VN97_g2685 [Penicillium thymicola]
MTPPTRGEVEARVKKVIGEVMHRPPFSIRVIDVFAYDYSTRLFHYGKVVEGLEKEFNFKYPFSKNIDDNDNVIQYVFNAIELCIYESTIQDPDWRREHGLKD